MMSIRVFLLILLSSQAVLATEFSPGEATYMAYCATCHGEEGDGSGRAGQALMPSPRDFTASVSKAILSQERMIRSVSQGRPGTAMVPWEGRLSAKEITEVVAYIQQEFMDMDKHWLEGKTLYIRHCAPCHGDAGRSARWTKNSLNPPPRNFTTAQARRDLSRERMIDSVTHGRRGTAMMPFNSRLNVTEVGAVVDYIRSSFMQKGATSAAVLKAPLPKNTPVSPTTKIPKGFDVTSHLANNGGVDMSLVFPQGLQGDFKRGRYFFMHNCFSCHGKSGNGQGPRAKFIFPKPRNFHSLESKAYLNRPALFSAITYGKQGTVMPAWGRVLDEQQVADVAEFVFRAFIQEEGVMQKGESSPPEWKKKH